MSKDFKYKIKDNTLIIESCPNDILTTDLVNFTNIDSCKFIKKIYLCDGIKEIGEYAFSYYDFIESIRFPKTLKKIGTRAFFKCKYLMDFNIPEGIISIGDSAFGFCESLNNVLLPNSLKKLGIDAFACCYNLTNIKLSSNLNEIETGAFYYCKSLENVEFPEGIKVIKLASFKECQSLKNIKFPSSLIKIENEAFNSCISLNNIVFSEGIEEIGEESFLNCCEINELIFPESLKIIGERAFYYCSKLKKIRMNNGVIKIGTRVFSKCEELEDIKLSENLKTIPREAFSYCNNLKKIVLPNSVELLSEDVFERCDSLKEIILSKNVKKIPKCCFKSCNGLENITIPDGVEEIEMNAFFGCSILCNVYLPSTLKKIDIDAFEDCKNLAFLHLKNKNDIIRLDVYRGLRQFVFNPDKLLFLYNLNNGKYSFYKDGEYIEVDENLLLNNNSIKRMIDENNYDRGMYIKYYYWSQKKFVPSNVVIENMPLNDIDNFYVNNNGYEWSKLIKSSINVTVDENKASFFKLCYVLGLFSESTSIRDRAVKFLNEKIVNIIDGYHIHERFDGFDLNNGFNEEYAEFFMKYYDYWNFMKAKDEYDDEIDLMAASYNNFKNVKKVYPNKTLHTNRKADLLLPKHVMNAVRLVEYYDVDPENKDFAIEVGKYGYSQKQFERLQDWYNTGKSIKEMKLFISKDENEEGITYKLLNKEAPLNAVLGNITNCCQVLGGMGESCVEYGMTKPNSGFIIFYYKDRIIGQAWVWYDETSKTLCLDNIEVPHKYLEKIEHNKAIQNSFIECLLRIEENFKKEMNKKGLKVERVTIGKGYNDIKDILDKQFTLVDNPTLLSGYTAYSDASSQYEIINRNVIRKK